MDHVPFRLTPALQHLMTPIGVHGTLAESMMATVSCLHSNLSFIEDYASLYFSGDMIPWHKNHNTAVVTRNVQLAAHAKQPPPSSPQSPAMAPPLQKVLNLSQVVDRNVDQVLQRIRDLAPLDAAPEHDRTTCLSRSTPSGDPSCVNQAVHELIKIASNPVHLSRQDVLWQPFF